MPKETIKSIVTKARTRVIIILEDQEQGAWKFKNELVAKTFGDAALAVHDRSIAPSSIRAAKLIMKNQK